jgi:type IV pilus biogenesis protein CpaD/CtpE
MEQEVFPMASKSVLLGLVAILVAGCGSGPREADSRSRAIASDIEATHQTSPSVITRGQRARNEPYGALPWQVESRH